MTFSRELHQFFTPAWASERLVELFFPQLGKDDVVLEPSCGDGSFLKAIPAEVPAIGVEIDPVVAGMARMNSYRQAELKRMLPRLKCFGMTAKGFPKHPLYLASNTKLVDFN